MRSPRGRHCRQRPWATRPTPRQILKIWTNHIKENLENEIDRLQKVMAEQDKQFEKLGKKRNEVEYDEKGHVVVDINDERQMKLWSE